MLHQDGAAALPGEAQPLVGVLAAGGHAGGPLRPDAAQLEGAARHAERVALELERLAKVASAERRLAEIYASELGALSGDDASSAKLCRRTGEIYAALGEIASALTWLRRAHEFEPESRVSSYQAIPRSHL